MIRIGITGHPDFPIDEWSKQSIELGELFVLPDDLTKNEICFARGLMETLKIETDDDENLIELITQPSDFMSFLVNIKRISSQYEKQTTLN